ncbi:MULTISPECIES: hypothetical protein [unclassified Pseudoalteromonas]|uniref:hypothetical protein n=1 Tax=unclassified Pseudoalteromonas TaxID=194690 RepID=UPI00046582E2|nr:MULTISPECIES: hypothetical protein [unclassified Pseudoalteromonas]
MFYFLLFLSLAITLTGVRIATLKEGFSRVTRTVMMLVPTVALIYIIWQAYPPYNFYMRLLFIAIIFEIVLRISIKVEVRYNSTLKPKE